MNIYYIDGNRSGFVDTFGSMGWLPEELYGPDLQDFDEDGRAIVAGRAAAIDAARDLFASFSPPALGEGDEYRVRYDVLRLDGSLVKRFQRIERGQ